MQIPTIHNALKTPINDPWMKCPSIQAEYPGLAFIYPLEQLIVAEKRDALHDIIGKTGIAYTIFNSTGQKVFLAVLEKRFRNFKLKIFNNYGNEVITVKRPFTIWTNRALVWAPPGNYVGSVHESKSCVNTYIVKNQDGNSVLKIIAEGMFQYVYKVYLVYGGHAIGVVRKQFPTATATIMNVKNFGISFPAELDVRDKAVLLGACFLIGYLKY